MDARSLTSDPVAGSDPHVDSLVGVLRLKDPETYLHSRRVGALAREWILHLHSRGRCLEVDAESVEIAAFLHDLGKIGVSSALLAKAGPLDAVERAILREHSGIGYEMLRAAGLPDEITLGVLHHHERWDGAGYPAGLKGEEIPVLARLISIVDAFDAMTSNRNYQRSRSGAEAIKEIRLNSGKQFCPEWTLEFAQFLDARNG